jgi:DNA-binding transcriptional LysR family regulator
MLTVRDESRRAVADQATMPRGVLSVGANEATCLYLLPEVFAGYHAQFPAVQISIYRNFSHKVLQKVEDGSVDVGIVTLPVKAPSLKTYPIFRDRVVLMCAPDNPLANHKGVKTSEIAEQPLIFPKTGFTRQMLDKVFRPYRSRLRVVMELPSVGMIKLFVAAGLGVTLISESFAKKEAKSGEVKLIPLADGDIWRELGLVYRRDRSLPRSAAAFVNIVRQMPGALEGRAHKK